MQNESPVAVDRIMICSYDCGEATAYNNNRIIPTMDCRHDLLIDSSFEGVAVQVDLINIAGRGVRRKMSLTLIDKTLRCEIKKIDFTASIPKGNAYATKCLLLPHSEVGFAHDHTYSVVIKDETANTTLDSFLFHTFDEKEFGHPLKWYSVFNGGILPESADELYRSVDVAPYTALKVRFNLEHNFKDKTTSIKPELEVRLYFPDEDRVKVKFFEPEMVEPDMAMGFVEMPFLPTIRNHGTFYAEVLCMQYPLAGFVFKTNGPEVTREWYGQGIEPLGQYSQSAAENRFVRLTPDADDAEESEETAEEKADDFCDFDQMLDDFLASQNEEQLEVSEPFCSFPESEPEPEPVSIMKSLEDFTGLHSVKEKLCRYEKLVKFNKMRADKGLAVTALPLHAMFLGSPGTGKTSVAKRVGQMLRNAGVLSSGHVVVKERATLLGQNYNSESENTLKAIEEAQGGILFIDEAYQLFQPNDSRDPGKFVIETLLTALADESKRDWMLILAGYPEKMEPMFEMNPGFKSRIPDSNVYTFDDFKVAELMEIAEKYLSRNGYTLTPEAREALSRRLKTDYTQRNATFGNARHVINLIQTDIVPAMAVRVMDSDTDNADRLSVIEAEDIPAPIVIVPQPAVKKIGYCA